MRQRIRPKKWTDVDRAFVAEWGGLLDTAVIAAFLDRSIDSVMVMVKKARNSQPADPELPLRRAAAHGDTAGGAAEN